MGLWGICAHVSKIETLRFAARRRAAFHPELLIPATGFPSRVNTKLRVLATTALNHGPGDSVQDRVAIQAVLHEVAWDDED
jgi:hypothetical protein